jgi:UDP-glucose 4-epimerase
MKVLVTGGAGFIGSHLVDRLVLDPAANVSVLDNFSRGRLEHLAPSENRVRIVRGDIRDRTLLREAMSGVDLVYHLAAQSNVLGAIRDLDYSFQTNVVGTYEVLRAAAAVGVRRVIFTSSREVYGEPASLPVPESAPLAPKNAYGVSKATGEMYCRLLADARLEVVVFRLANVYGPRDRDRVIPLFAEQALRGEPLTVFGSGKVLDFLWIGDLVDVLYQASQCPCPDGPINLGSGKGINLVDLAKRISALAGGGSTVSVTGERQPEVGHFVADVAAARRLFQFHCPEDPVEHVPEIVEHLRGEMRTHADHGELSRP